MVVGESDANPIPSPPSSATQQQERRSPAADETTGEPSRGTKRRSPSPADPPPQPQPKRARVVGLKNLGNTCYNNAVIQALSHTTPLREYFLHFTSSSNSAAASSSSTEEVAAVTLQPNRPRTRRAARLEKKLNAPSDANLCTEFSKLLRSMWGGEGIEVGTRSRRMASVVSPHAFAGAVATLLPLFQERYEQQDAQEFLRCALERMQHELIEEMLKNSPSNIDIDLEDTIINRVFGGVLWNKISCLSCLEYTIKPDPFLDLSLVIPTPTTPTVTLEDCLDLFSSSEDLESPSLLSPESRTCYSCGSESGFSKDIKIGELPTILCVHLKRFRWKADRKQKVDTLVRFPLDGLDMTRWLGDTGGTAERKLYELYAVVVHQGSGANSGHYSAFVKSADEWWCLNDERAARAKPEQVQRAKAYLLFYRQQEGVQEEAESE